jgi:hypothetical protein
MIKISANLSKKVPLPGIDYSSQQFGAAMEIEISDTDRPDAIKQRIQEVYALLSQTVDEQITTSTAIARSQLPPPRQQNTASTPQNGRRYQNGRSNGRPVMATEAQQRALFAIAKQMNLDLNPILASYNATDASQLTVRDASALIDDLKSQQNGNGTPRQ